MIKNIIYVEDGSINVDELQESLGEDTKIIIYRQGATKPVVEQLVTPIKTDYDTALDNLRHKIEKAGWVFVELLDMKKSKKVNEKIKLLHDIIFETD